MASEFAFAPYTQHNTKYSWSRNFILPSIHLAAQWPSAVPLVLYTISRVSLSLSLPNVMKWCFTCNLPLLAQKYTLIETVVVFSLCLTITLCLHCKKNYNVVMLLLLLFFPSQTKICMAWIKAHQINVMCPWQWHFLCKFIYVRQHTDIQTPTIFSWKHFEQSRSHSVIQANISRK